MRILLDENFPLALLWKLQEEGHQVDHIILLGLRGAPDRTIIDRLNSEALRALASPEVKEKLTVLGAEPMPMSPAAFDAFIKAEAARMAQVVKSAGIQVQ